MGDDANKNNFTKFYGDGEKGSTNWKKEEHLDTRAYGSVFRATKKTSEGVMVLAVKEIKIPKRSRNQNIFQETITKETDALRKLSHERIIKYYGVCSTDRTHHIFIEYMPCGSLKDYIEEKGIIDEEEVKRFTQQILEGVAYLHDVGFFHRDIKSANILMPDKFSVKLADFGLTREFLELTQSYTTGAQGTVRFMAPEMFSTRYNIYVDIWSVGCVVLHMLTGKQPFHELREQQQVMYRLTHDPSPINSLSFPLSRTADEFLKKTSQFDPRMRPDATALLEDEFVKSPRKLLLIGKSGDGCGCSVRSIERFDSLREIMVAVKSHVYTGEGLVEPTESVVNNVRGEILRYKEFNAIVFVMKYGVRFTKQEKDAVEMTKKMFGEDVFRRYGVILMTYGDLFQFDNEDEHEISFAQWCRSQTGDIQKLFEEVNYRIILFDNKTIDCGKLEAQFNMLRSVVLEINAAYDMKTFERARSLKEELVKSSKLRLSQRRKWIKMCCNDFLKNTFDL